LLLLLVFSGCPEETTMPWRPATQGVIDAGQAQAAPRESVGELKVAKGSVWLTRNANRAPALPGPLFVGDVVETDANAEAMLLFASQREVTLGPDGRYEVRSADSGLILEIEKGELKTRSTLASGSGDEIAFSIETPRAVTRLKSADAVNIGIRGDSVDFEVVSGRIQYLTPEGETVVVEAGARRRLTPVAVIAQESKSQGTLAVSTISGRLLHKPSGAAAFSPVNVKSPPKLGEGDSLRSDGETQLTAEGATGRFTLERGSEVVVGLSARGNGREGHVLRLNRGQLSVRADEGMSTTIELSDNVTIDIVKGGQIVVSKTKAGFTVTSLTGAVRINQQGKPPTLVGGGRIATISPQSVDVQTPPREFLALPTRNGLRVYHPGVSRVSLLWNSENGDAGGEAPEYRVQVASESSFATPIVSGVVEQRFVTVPLPRRGTLFWRVYDPKTDQELTRGNALVAPEPLGQDLSRLKNDVLAGNEKTTIYFQDKPPLFNFLFTQEPGAAKYSMKVFREGDLTRSVAERTVEGLWTSLPEGTLSEGKYLWSVTPLDATGQPIRGGRLNKLEIIYDNAVSNLLIRNPKNGETFGKSLKVSGVAPSGAKVFANGKALATDEKGRFEDAVEAVGGKVVFRMLSGASEVYTVRSARVKP
jgi:hypothetical protein